MAGSRSPANTGTCGCWKVAIATTTLSVSKRRSPATTSRCCRWRETRSTRRSSATGSSNRHAYVLEKVAHFVLRREAVWRSREGHAVETRVPGGREQSQRIPPCVCCACPTSGWRQSSDHVAQVYGRHVADRAPRPNV